MTDELVEAQLKALYALGILSSDGEEEERAYKEDRRGAVAHDRFLLALPPASAPWNGPIPRPGRLDRQSLNSSGQSAEEEERSSYAGSLRGSSGSSGSDLGIRATLRPSEILQRPKRLRRQAARVPPPRSLDPAILACFDHWKSYTAERRRTTSLRLLADECLKKRGVHRWCRFLHWERYEQERVSRLYKWKAVRACKSWRRWTTRRRRLQQLISLEGRSLASRHRKALVWRRWSRFYEAEKLAKLRVAAQRRRSSLRLLRRAWNELVAFKFMSGQTRQLVRRCFKRLDRFREQQAEQRHLIEAYQASLKTAKLRWLIKRWRIFAYLSSYDRRCIRRVRCGIVRRRFFALWQLVYRTRSRTAKFRQRAEQQKLLTHLNAWLTVARAMTLAYRVTSEQAVKTRRLLFEHWTIEARRKRISKDAKVAIEAKRLSKAIATMKKLTAQSRQYLGSVRSFQAAHDKRLQKHVWTKGWLRFHTHQQQIRKIEAGINRMLLRRTAKLWMRYHAIQTTHRLQIKSADAFQRVQSCRRLWRNWRSFVIMRRTYNHVLGRAGNHYTSQLLRRGVSQWYDTVNQNSEAARRVLAVRHNQRVRLKTQSFACWTIWTRAKRQPRAVLESLQRTPTYPSSLLNPARRAWCRWSAFVRNIKQNKRSHEFFKKKQRQKMFRALYRQASVANQVRIFQSQRQASAKQRVLRGWRCVVEWNLKRSANITAATQLYELKATRNAFRSWMTLTTGYLRHVRACRLKLERKYILQQQCYWFQVWMEKFHTRRHISETFLRRQRRLLQMITQVWHKYASKRACLRQKLEYFRKIYGNYPHSSLARRIHLRWRQSARHSVVVRTFKQKHRRRFARTFWQAWCCFVRYRCIFRAWRILIRSSGVDSTSFRVRHFRKLHRRRLKVSAFARWRQLLSERRHRVEHFSRLRFQVYLELHSKLRALHTAKLCYDRRWFNRWRFNESRSSVRFKRRYQSRLLRKVLQGWWRLSVHTRQEKVLHDAKRIIGTLSYYQEPDFEQTALVVRAIERKPHTRAKEDARSTRKSSRNGSRAMTDPMGPTTYSTLNCRSKEALYDGVPSRQRQPIQTKDVATCSVSQRSKRTAFDNEITQDAIDTEWLHRQSLRGNENISLVNMALLPPHEPATQLSVIKSSRPMGPTTSDEVVAIVPGQTQRDGYPYKQQPREVQIRNEPTHPARDCEVAARPSCDLATNTTSAIVELPLFDADNVGQHLSQQPLEYSTTAKRLGNEAVSHPSRADHPFPSTPISAQLDPEERQGSTAMIANTAPHLSLESLMNLDVYGELPRSATTKVEAASAAATTKNATTEAKFTKEADTQRRSGPIIKVRQSARIPIRQAFVDPGTSEKRPLSDILGLHTADHLQTKARTKRSSAVVDSGGCDGRKRSLDKIIAHYAQQMQSRFGVQGHSTTQQQAWQVCFEMMRDLRLLQNDFYICELERIFRGITFLAPKSEPLLSQSDHDLVLVKTCEQLKLFLHQAISAHPAYITASKLLQAPPCFDSEGSIFESLSRADQLQYPSLQWLVGAHLPLFVCQESPGPNANPDALQGNYWTRHAMPQNIKLSLDKFIPIVKKYTNVLSQFFARGAGAFNHPGIGAIDPRDYRMTRQAFFALMKQARVFPQLFHRRELERAFEMSVLTDQVKDAVNFPEFVELLARCSSSLQWGTSSCSKTPSEESSGQGNSNESAPDAATASVIKFLMLIFAMEGKGSVLRKRSEDLDVVIKFLHQQQQQIREHKMRRFKKLLVQQEASRKAQRTERTKKAARPVTKVLLSLSTSKQEGMLSPLALAAPSPARTFDDHTHSWDFEWLPSQHGEQAAKYPGRSGHTSEWRSQCLEQGHSRLETKEPSQDETTSWPNLASCSSEPSQLLCEPASAAVSSDATGLWPAIGDVGCIEMDGKAAMSMDDDGKSTTLRTGDLLDLSSPLPPYDASSARRHTLSKSDFLDEILSSIGAVELFLHQSSQRLERRRPSIPTLMDDRLHGNFDSEQQRHYTHHLRSEQSSSSIAPLPSGFLLSQPDTTSSSASLSLGCIASDLGGILSQCDGMYDDSEDVQVKDAMLDYLTDVKRFSDPCQGGEAAISVCEMQD